MNKIVSFVLARLKEKSTLTTIVTLVAGIAGVSLSPENKEVIATAVLGVVSAIAMFWGEDKPAA